MKDGSTPNTAQTENGANQFGPFFSGKIGMFVNGTYPYVELKKSHPEIEFGIELVPSKDGSAAASFAGGDDIAITKRIDKATGMEVLKWFTSEGQQLLAKSGVLPIRSDVAQADYVSLDPRNQVFVDALKYGHIPKSPEGQRDLLRQQLSVRRSRAGGNFRKRPHRRGVAGRTVGGRQDRRE